MAEISIDNVRKAFGAHEILHGVSAKVADGEFVVLVGPSGCGKSTLLRMIAGLETVGSGTIRIGDRVVNDVTPQDRNVAMVFQNYALYPHMTVYKNLAFSLRFQGASRAESDEKVRRAAGILGLTELLDRYPRQLSGGQRQRVAMGRAIVRDPLAFLFDEPLSNLDAKLRVQMRVEIKALHQRLRTTIVYVTHDQIEAMTMADRIVVMRDGSVEQVGAPLEVYDSPVNRFVAGFIGSPAMNFLDTRYVTVGGPGVRTAGGTVLQLATQANLAENQPVVYGVRPEHLEVSSTGIPVVVSVVEPTGSETHIFARAGEQDVTAIVRERVDVIPGQTIHLKPKADRVHLFDAESGLRLPH
ncbi:MAG TPA: sn-glycerol-3-phosphate ABC transporter ATP-binding protein UgpC [Ramlibacter sp.]|uniref:ABC transporter ATP-binding protein n=1 Tax=Ramlibacter sp. TaxID=1917967 RepID=UPI002BD2599F|nr:sn-glycerol-3-phosphate ABC transporter ATP-binding protein UgpC [Ramlibacter sp.]HVZ45729.1 sn-glycerol-3-phosphate ABC transporter ATP-binding protein UgpC [Ramlibacter sp.]